MKELHRLKAYATCGTAFQAVLSAPGNNYRVLRPSPLVWLAKTRSAMTLPPNSNPCSRLMVRNPGYRHMYIREIDLVRQKTEPLVVAREAPEGADRFLAPSSRPPGSLRAPRTPNPAERV